MQNSHVKRRIIFVENFIETFFFFLKILINFLTEYIIT